MSADQSPPMPATFPERRIAHLSDLHFGAEEPDVVKEIVQDLHKVNADLVLVSGDLTQRAKRLEFVAAGEFLRRLGIPWIAVPGNHDLPRSPARILRPFGDYRDHVFPTLMPRHVDDQVAVLGLTTASPLIWTGGVVTPRALSAIRRWSRQAGDRLRIVFSHHPISKPDTGGHPLVNNWRAAIRTMEEAGVDVVCTGHHHVSGHSESRAYVVGGPHRLIIVRAGTATSWRRRGEQNTYNLLRYDGHRIHVERRQWEDGRFKCVSRQRFTRRRQPLPPRPSRLRRLRPARRATVRQQH